MQSDKSIEVSRENCRLIYTHKYSGFYFFFDKLHLPWDTLKTSIEIDLNDFLKIDMAFYYFQNM